MSTPVHDTTPRLDRLHRAAPAAQQLPVFRVERRPTPITAPSTEVTIAVIFDGSEKLPDDWLSQIQCAIIKAKQQAGIADALTPGQQLYWGGR